MSESWVPVVRPKPQPGRRGVDVPMVDLNSSLPFLENTVDAIDPTTQDPVEVIVARVLYSILISVSLVINLLLVVAVIKCKGKVLVIYLLTSSMMIPDIIFYIKVIVELTDWTSDIPEWATTNKSCGVWQFAGHVYPLLYSFTLTAIVYHAFITLFLDHSGKYETRCRRLLPLILVGMVFFLSVVSAPSAFYARSLVEEDRTVTPFTKQYCHLVVPSITGSVSEEVLEQSYVTYRLVYELVLPYLLPLTLFFFPYVCLLVGLMKSLEATDHSEHSTKMTVVVTLWLVTSFMMMHVATLLRTVFSVFSVWHKLTTALNAEDDPRVPVFQTYLHITSYALTILWAIARPSLIFKYSPRLRKALGP